MSAKSLIQPQEAALKGKAQRELAVLMALVELYLQTGKPIGSTTLQGDLFKDLSSATIRNYFAKLEEAGFLEQLHLSGGRVPTAKAYRLYVDQISPTPIKNLFKTLDKETKEIASFLEVAAGQISELANTALFLSSPRFDNDFVTKIRLLDLGDLRVLCIISTDFGLVHTEVVHIKTKLTAAALKRIELFFHTKLTGTALPQPLSTEEMTLGENLYNELMLRQIASHSSFQSEDIYKTGFSKLLAYPEFAKASSLSSALSLFESSGAQRQIISQTLKNEGVNCLIGPELGVLLKDSFDCSVIAVPYKINQTAVGAIALLGPMRLPYKTIFALLEEAADKISATLTRSVYKFKITYRQPEIAPSPGLIQKELLLLEDLSN